MKPTQEFVINDTLEAVAYKAVQLYAETHPRPCHVTQVQAAEMIGVSRPTITRMIKAGQITLNKFGLIPINQIDKALAARQR
jgi:excisionase family DNA binding protein